MTETNTLHHGLRSLEGEKEWVDCHWHTTPKPIGAPVLPAGYEYVIDLEASKKQKRPVFVVDEEATLWNGGVTVYKTLYCPQKQTKPQGSAPSIRHMQWQ